MTIELKINEFLANIRQSIAEDKFIKLSLGNYKGSEEALKKIYIKRILIKREKKLSFTYQYKTKDVTKNYGAEEGIGLIREALATGFHIGTLFTTSHDLTFESFHNKALLKKAEPSNRDVPSLDHDRSKKRLIKSNDKVYLQELKITDTAGNVFKNAQDKYKQINRYVEILNPLVKNLGDKKINVVDMGSGKGYLTFALYDYMTNQLELDVKVTGVEYREDMVALCNQVADKSGFDGLNFVQGSIGNYEDVDMNVLIALHACDTATDDAIFKGIAAEAELIVVAPCCHKQIRRELEKNKAHTDLDFLLKHGILLERQAEMATDGLRSLILEYAGYTTKVFEFISEAHTAKNVMITAEKNTKSKKNDPALLNKIKDAKTYFGIEYHHLEKLMEL